MIFPNTVLYCVIPWFSCFSYISIVAERAPERFSHSILFFPGFLLVRWLADLVDIAGGEIARTNQLPPCY